MSETGCTRRRVLLAGLGTMLLGGAARAQRDPAVIQEMRNLYGLSPGQDVKVIPKPFHPVRQIWYRQEQPFQAEQIPAGPDILYFRFQDEALRYAGMTFGGGGGTEFPELMDRLYAVPPQDVEGDPELLRRKLPGDFTGRLDAPPERLEKQLTQLLQEQFKVPGRVRFTQGDRKLLVARGKFAFKPIPNRNDQIEIYGHSLNDDPNLGGGGSGSMEECIKHLGEYVNRRMACEVEGAPGMVRWHHNRRFSNDPKVRAEDRDPVNVLKHFTEQTGVRFEEETRKVRVVVLERVNP